MSGASIKAIEAYIHLCEWERIIASAPPGEDLNFLASNRMLHQFQQAMAKTTKEALLRTRSQRVSLEQCDEMVRRASGGTSALLGELDWRTHKHRRWQRRVADAPAGYTIWETRVGPTVKYDIGKVGSTIKYVRVGSVKFGVYSPPAELWSDLDPFTAQAVLFRIQQPDPAGTDQAS